MPITFEISSEQDLASVTFEGYFTHKEAEKALATFRAQGGMAYRRIFEFRRPLEEFDFAVLKGVCMQMNKEGTGRPMALVGDTSLALEVCEAIARLTSPAKPRVFTDRVEAESWIKTQ